MINQHEHQHIIEMTDYSNLDDLENNNINLIRLNYIYNNKNFFGLIILAFLLLVIITYYYIFFHVIH